MYDIGEPKKIQVPLLLLGNVAPNDIIDGLPLLLQLADMETHVKYATPGCPELHLGLQSPVVCLQRMQRRERGILGKQGGKRDGFPHRCGKTGDCTSLLVAIDNSEVLRYDKAHIGDDVNDLLVRTHVAL
jgi:hypothetical protein